MNYTHTHPGAHHRNPQEDIDVGGGEGATHSPAIFLLLLKYRSRRECIQPEQVVFPRTTSKDACSKTRFNPKAMIPLTLVRTSNQHNAPRLLYSYFRDFDFFRARTVLCESTLFGTTSRREMRYFELRKSIFSQRCGDTEVNSLQ